MIESQYPILDPGQVKLESLPVCHDQELADAEEEKLHEPR